MAKRKYCCSLKISYTSVDAAEIARVLTVDEELQPTKVTKNIVAEDQKLLVTFACTDPKILRVALSSFYDMIIVATKALQEFG
eukprot:CAMPEP_0113936828 /NCGR_PEP_ID=MMETSP1339-20121228/3610_1 /TAXON_ID=94617 /ORGANISM="Fibrocapsa japonica" /LENGTH=82 /DNA_ID=CAMNT_0000939389 /DNA_START=85 /DNA_END=333 /DNA_ORIENTATION=- /assembly_acc=CAM_ASM_000762